MAEIQKPQSCRPGKPLVKQVHPEDLGLALVPMVFLAPFSPGAQNWILHLWWVFFFIILYKNKSAFRNLFALSLTRSLFLFFFLSFQLFIEVGCNL